MRRVLYKTEASEAWSPSGGGLYKGHLHRTQMTLSSTVLHFFFVSQALLDSLLLDWMKWWDYLNLNWPAQTTEENEPVFDERTPVLSPGVNTHTCPTMEDIKYQNSYWVCKNHSVVVISSAEVCKDVNCSRQIRLNCKYVCQLPWKPFSMFHPRVITRLPTPQAPITAKALNIIITTWKGGEQATERWGYMESFK